MWKILHFLNANGINHRIIDRGDYIVVAINEYRIDKKDDYFNLRMNNEVLITEEDAEHFCNVLHQHDYKTIFKKYN